MTKEEEYSFTHLSGWVRIETQFALSRESIEKGFTHLSGWVRIETVSLPRHRQAVLVSPIFWDE